MALTQTYLNHSFTYPSPSHKEAGDRNDETLRDQVDNLTPTGWFYQFSGVINPLLSGVYFIHTPPESRAEQG